MAGRYKVVSQKGTCARKHKAGQEWVLGAKTPEGICIYSYNALHPFVQVLMSGGSFHWEPDPEAIKVACPDPENPVVWELRRLRK